MILWADVIVVRAVWPMAWAVGRVRSCARVIGGFVLLDTTVRVVQLYSCTGEDEYPLEYPL